MIAHAIRTALALALVACLAAVALGQDPDPAPGSDSRRVPGTGVSLTPPVGYEPTQQFPGFIKPTVGASIMVTVVPGPYDAVSAGFASTPRLRAQAMVVIAREDRPMVGAQGSLLRIDQKAGEVECASGSGRSATPRRRCW